MIEPVNDHVEQAELRLRQQYKDLPKLGGLLGALVAQVQDLEDAFQQLAVERGLDAAEGIQLDSLGDIIGADRVGGESDDDYRLRLRAKIAQNISQGEPEAVITLTSLLVGASMTILSEGYDASVQLMTDVDITTQEQINFLYRQLEFSLAAGVRLDALGHFRGVDSFSFSGTTDGAGFGTVTDAAAGGRFGHIYKNKNFEFSFAGNDPKGGGFGTITDPLVGGVMKGL